MRKFLLSLICICLMAIQSWAQSRTITGKVVDDKGAPVPNASVQIKGTTTGATAGNDGSFSLTVNSNKAVLVVTAVGFAEYSENVGNKGNFLIALTSSDAALSEVVVVGYQTLNKRQVSGSVAKISNDVIANKPVLSFDQALTGAAAGLQINTASGLVGDNVSIRLRGVSSISSGSQPLIIMDGVPLTQGNQGQLYNPANPLADINPNDIESVEVLKDASATAIYGSRASGGVLIVTTKKGKSGQSNVNYDGYVGFNEVTRKLKVLNGDQYNTVINKLRSNAGAAASAFYGDYNGDGVADPVSTDWQNAVFRKGLTQNQQVSISGGNGKTTYYGSVNYNDLQSYIIINRQRRYSARMNVTSKATNWLTVGINAQYSKTQSYGLGSGTGGALSGIPYGPLTAAPNIPVYDSTGAYYIGNGGNTIGTGTPNPVAVTNLNKDNRDSRRFIGSAFGEVEVIKGLKLKSQINLDYLTAYNDQFWDPYVGDGQGTGVAQSVYSDRNTWDWYNTINYTTKIKRDHYINFLGGIEYMRSRGIYSYVSGSGLIDPDFKLITPSNYQSVTAENGINGVDDGLASYFGGFNYAFQDKYTATFNMRSDSYSGFGQNHKTGYFPAGSVSWHISQEEFMKNIKFLRDLKIRSSYGITGNSNIGYFPSLSTYATAQYGDLTSLTLTNPGNADLKWERTKQFDAGIDATVGKATNITLDFYTKTTADLILQNPVLATLGFPGNVITQNIGQLRNSGVELAINTPIITRKAFTYDINFNIAYNRNKVLATNSNNDDVLAANSIARPGQQLSAFYLIRYGGVDPQNGHPRFLDATGNSKEYDPASKTWTSAKDGTSTTAISSTDRVVLNKTPYPKILGGLSQNLKYKNFDFNLNLQYAFGVYLYNSNMQTLMAPTNVRNKSTKILNAWTTAGQNTDVPMLYYGDAMSAQTSDRFLENASFVRIRNVQVGYALPKELLSKAGVKGLRFYVSVQNLYTITGYKGIDPEANSNAGSSSSTTTNIGWGIDAYRAYMPRTFLFGAALSL